jgi:hypothetical protein
MFGYAIDIPNKAVAFADYLGYWADMNNKGNRAGAFVCFFAVPLFFNCLNVRKYGRFEFGLTLIKIMTVLGLIILGIVIGAGGVTSPLLGTSAEYRPVPCAKNAIGQQCLSPPGFACKHPFYLAVPDMQTGGKLLLNLTLREELKASLLGFGMLVALQLLAILETKLSRSWQTRLKSNVRLCQPLSEESRTESFPFMYLPFSLWGYRSQSVIQYCNCLSPKVQYETILVDSS